MAFEAPRIDEMFGGLPAEQRVDRFEAYKSALSQCHAKALAGTANFDQQVRQEVGLRRERDHVACDHIFLDALPSALPARAHPTTAKAVLRERGDDRADARAAKARRAHYVAAALRRLFASTERRFTHVRQTRFPFTRPPL